MGWGQPEGRRWAIAARRRVEADRKADGKQGLGPSLALAAATVVALIGIVVLVGWGLDSTTLKSVSPGLSEMKANTALGFILAGLSLLLLLSGLGRPAKLVGQALAVALAALGVLTLLEYVSGLRLGIDELLFVDESTVATLEPGRMGANTALCFTIGGISLLLLDAESPDHARPAQLGAVAVGFVTLITLLGYLFEVTRLERGFIGENLTPMALHTAVALLIFAAGLLFARPGVGMAKLVVSDSAGGVMVRRLLGPAVAISILLGYLRVAGERADLYGPSTGSALLVAALVLVLAMLIWHTGRTLERIDSLRLATEARRRAILESSLDPIVAIDAAGRILEFNPAAEQVFGYRAEEAVGQDLAEKIVPPDLRARHRQALARNSATGESSILGRRVELTGMRADGSEFPVELSITRSDEPQGRVFSGFLRDLTEHKRAETERQRLEAEHAQLQKMDALGQLTGGIVHDFNNVLAVILSSGSLIGRQLDERHPAQREVGEIVGAAQGAAGLTRQLLAFSRGQQLNPERLVLNDAVLAMAPVLRRLLGNELQLQTELDPAGPEVEVDPSQLSQIILNLVVNARDAMPGIGVVRIATAAETIEATTALAVEPGPYAVLRVSDSGSGMSPQTQARALEPFFTTKGEQGTGLGLSTIYGIVKQSGGELTIESAPGEGTTVSVLLPLLRRAAPATAGEPGGGRRSMARSGGPGGRIALLIEDDPAQRRSIARTLRRLGFEVAEADGAEQAISLAEGLGDELALGVFDHVPPSGSDVEALAAILDRQANLRLLFISGAGEPSALAAKLAAPTAYLQKPFGATTLIRAVQDLLAEARR